ncbi:type II toxin-antitoxin system RelE/ParE family toxin [Mesorhizobium sp. J428]|uniref:type II toxin-antitoxin system RelE/ParE family toxin n=1 Tax=Mesorhizobium sp. J428 TaxID=2898440 RepID=UPI00215169F1|nr:type II toxin-antitoxin system RelE/ParE family toxin [Mesorhizobium sp. J428]MCR5858480.1 type II toxin-antitoxin system RelE/ParE family toxin [Mesorhizobium sp. J428]
MRRIRYLGAAKRDIARIFEFVTRESGSADIGLRVIYRIREKCRRLAMLPGTLGRSRSELADDLRSVASGSYIIFFRYRGNLVEIANVIEGHRDLPSAINEKLDPN